ncbi:NAD(P)H-binding protein [Haloactinopolyspora alba]
MRFTVFGATGQVGRRVVAEALTRGHDVTAVARTSARTAELPRGARPRTGDASDAATVAQLGAGQDVVIGATRPPAGRERDLVSTAKALVGGLAGTGTRLLLVGGAATLTVPGDGGTTVLDDPAFLPVDYRDIALACAEQLEVCRGETTVDWAYLSPPAMLAPGARTGTYRVGGDELLVDDAGRSAISMEDLAVALLDEAERPRQHRQRFTVAY